MVNLSGTPASDLHFLNVLIEISHLHLEILLQCQHIVLDLDVTAALDALIVRTLQVIED